MEKFSLTQSNFDTAYLKFPRSNGQKDRTVKKSIRINSLIEEKIDFDIRIDITDDGHVLGIEILGD